METATVGPWASRSERWGPIDILLRRPGPFAGPDHSPSDVAMVEDFVRDQCPVLVIGAGGLGCELLKDLALSGFGNIEVIDMDVVDVTNLNRQFLFKLEDVGRPKAEVAARFINERVKGVNVKGHHGDIKAFGLDFYSRFRLVVAGLDSIEARRWLNAALVKLCEVGPDGKVDRTTLIPLIDGGTEGFAGQARVVFPRISACFECTLALFPPTKNFPLCTIANTPRLPEHCIEYVDVVVWNQEHPFGTGVKLDTDNADHVKWIHERALERASDFGISGVTYRLTQGVLKNIIPAVASTNAIVAASCANEALKIATSLAGNMDNYMMYNGSTGVYTYTYKNEKREDCPVCGLPRPLRLPVNPESTVSDLVAYVANHRMLMSRKPVLRSAAGKTLYASHPPVLEKATRSNLAHKLSKFMEGLAEIEITITDKDLPILRSLIVVFDTAIPLPDEAV